MATPQGKPFPGRFRAAVLAAALAVTATAGESLPPHAEDAASRPETAADASAAELTDAIDAILTHSYSGIDTSAVLARVRERLQWGEKDERLLEAESVLLWDRGDWRSAMASLTRLSRPSALSMSLLGEGYLRKGQK